MTELLTKVSTELLTKLSTELSTGVLDEGLLVMELVRKYTDTSTSETTSVQKMTLDLTGWFMLRGSGMISDPKIKGFGSICMGAYVYIFL